MRRKIKIITLLLLFNYTAAAVSAEEDAAASGKNPILISESASESLTDISDPVFFLGMNPRDIFKTIGPPEEIYPLRGENHWQDDVVFYYNSNFYLFLFRNRVWQVRADYRYKDKILGIKAGYTKEQAIDILGKPFSQKDGELMYLNPADLTRLETGFPLRMRILFDPDNRVSDIYLYRGDY